MQRPTSMTVVGWLLIAFGGFGLIGQLTMQNNPMTQQILAQSPLPAGVHMALGIIGILITLASGYGVLKGLNWSRYLYIGWSLVGLAISYLTMPFTSIILMSVIVIGVVAFFLFRPTANGWFTGEPPAIGE